MRRIACWKSIWTILAVRDRTMLEVMYGAGLRLAELVGMDYQHIDLASGEIWVMGKGSKERKLPIGKTAVTAGTLAGAARTVWPAG